MVGTAQKIRIVKYWGIGYTAEILKTMAEQYVSAQRLEELKNELKEFKTVKRAEIADRLKKAKELGDLSENSEYFEAREAQGHLEARIAELEELVKTAKVIEKSSVKGIVGFGTTVTVARNGKETRYTIVGAQEADPASGSISNESPMGSAVMGKKVGDSAKVQTPTGEATYKIIAIE